MDIRPIERDELAAFARFGDDDDRNGELADRLADWWERGASGPHWCFVTEDAGRIVGRAAFLAPPPSARPTISSSSDYPQTATT